MLATAMRIAIVFMTLCASAAAARAGGAVEAKLSCDDVMVQTVVWGDEPPTAENTHAAKTCSVAVGRAPAGALVATFRRTPRAAPDDHPIALPIAEGSAAVDMSLAPAPDCAPIRVDATITLDGHVAWRGRTRFTTECPIPRAHLTCTTPDGKPLGAHARLDRDVTCAIAADGGDLSGRFYVIATVARPFDDLPAVREGVDATFTAAGDLHACAATTFRGELDRGDEIVWSQAITIRPTCRRR